MLYNEISCPGTTISRFPKKDPLSLFKSFEQEAKTNIQKHATKNTGLFFEFKRLSQYK